MNRCNLCQFPVDRVDTYCPMCEIELARNLPRIARDTPIQRVAIPPSGYVHRDRAPTRHRSDSSHARIAAHNNQAK